MAYRSSDFLTQLAGRRFVAVALAPHPHIGTGQAWSNAPTPAPYAAATAHTAETEERNAGLRMFAVGRLGRW
jgi:hypothetical protein